MKTYLYLLLIRSYLSRYVFLSQLVVASIFVTGTCMAVSVKHDRVVTRRQQHSAALNNRGAAKKVVRRPRVVTVDACGLLCVPGPCHSTTGPPHPVRPYIAAPEPIWLRHPPPHSSREHFLRSIATGRAGSLARLIHARDGCLVPLIPENNIAALT